MKVDCVVLCNLSSSDELDQWLTDHSSAVIKHVINVATSVYIFYEEQES